MQDIFEDGESADLPENVAALQAYRNVDDQCITRLASIFDVMRILATADYETSQSAHVNMEMSNALCGGQLLIFYVVKHSQEAVLASISRIYKAAEVVSKRISASKGKPSKAFSSLIHCIGSKMNEVMYSAVFRYRTELCLLLVAANLTRFADL